MYLLLLLLFQLTIMIQSPNRLLNLKRLAVFLAHPHLLTTVLLQSLLPPLNSYLSYKTTLIPLVTLCVSGRMMLGIFTICPCSLNQRATGKYRSALLKSSISKSNFSSISAATSPNSTAIQLQSKIAMLSMDKTRRHRKRITC